MGTYVVLGAAFPYASCVRVVKTPLFEHNHPTEWDFDPKTGRALWDEYPAFVEALGDDATESGLPAPIELGGEIGEGLQFFWDGPRHNAVVGKEVGWFGAKTEGGIAGFDLDQFQTDLESLKPALAVVANAVGHPERADAVGLWFVTL